MELGVLLQIMRKAAETLIPVTLELGGKDAFIVCEDVDVPHVAQIAVRAALQSSGQNYAGAERFYVHRDVYSSFVAQVVKIVKFVCAARVDIHLASAGKCIFFFAVYLEDVGPKIKVNLMQDCMHSKNLERSWDVQETWNEIKASPPPPHPPPKTHIYTKKKKKQQHGGYS
ncbi:hypothetical protein NE237_024252 [Protea cynaroides]|uniref:Aldehyde dehydrogenase domain-containing protein n=1 Tax=Protea cynaroides TaxID=273540 RepID=A0A9Q0HGH8_9MAGN|nr:hypothetical protein NE237_024252 [Protea cynaroides]